MISIVLAGVIAAVLATAGVDYTTWQFWVVGALVGVLGVHSERH